MTQNLPTGPAPIPGDIPQQPPIWQPPAYQPGPPPPAPKKRRAGLIVLLVVAGLVGAFCLGGIALVATSGTDTTGPAADASKTAHRDVPADEPTEDALSGKIADTIDDGKPSEFATVSDRQWKQMAKNPDSYQGQPVVLHGEIWQFDSASGPNAFLASSGGKYQRPEYGFTDYPVDAMFTGDEATLESLVEGDLFTANVEVIGSLDYDTMIGGANTVPIVWIWSVKRTGGV